MFEPTFCEATGRALRECGGWCGQPPLPLKYVRICSKTFTKSEIEESVGAALAAPVFADSAAKAKFKFAESRRNKKNEEKRKNLRETKLWSNISHIAENQQTKKINKFCLLRPKSPNSRSLPKEKTYLSRNLSLRQKLQKS